MSGLLRTVDALELAAAWLSQAFTDCRCTAAAVDDLDVDPDCPGMVAIADGCRTHAHLAARIALHDAGVDLPQMPFRSLRSAVLAMHHDLVAEIDAIAARPRHDRSGPEQSISHIIRLLAGAINDEDRRTGNRQPRRRATTATAA